MARRIKPIDQVQFTNEIGQVIKPGDTVVAVTLCTKSVYVNEAKYLGTRGNAVVIEVNDSRRRFVHDETGEEYDYKSITVEHPGWYNPPYRTPYLNSYYGLTPEQEAANAKAKAEHEAKEKAYYAAVEQSRVGYSYKDFPFKRISQLQKNRIFLATSTVADLSGRLF